MIAHGNRFPVGGIVYLILAFMLGAYFTFAAVQGDYGVFRQVQIRAEAEALRIERDRLYEDLDRISNLTARLSDRYLDVDLLDERVRDVLGYVRPDEIVIR
ncbi:septum formation initiator family protein [Pseudorhodobacter sp. MZDSW-24AT]|uniref:FtsB family cell division protein n=1 Tax=Pseudorhodobacter sp. MZDSW-24AT TaxID=2052957 RepID=UPI000C1F66B6|nr:septum formation initiator family protein [Pseudorhodobacter sp. MZDSW-24AT]PJF11127.1 septum formation initiator precursor [Pseudorhodobacter sp. MZDSW-24AT]